MSSGFIKLHRKLTEWEWYNDINTTRLFVHLLICANHKSKKWKGIEINRGEYLTGRLKLSEETGLSPQQIRTSLNKLKSTSEITIKSTSKFSVIKLENYCVYQDRENLDQPTNQPTNHQTSNQQVTTTKECKEYKEYNNNINNNINSPIVPKKSKTKFNDFHLQVAKQLGEFVKENKKINLKMGDIKRWANEIRLLQDNDLKPRDDSQQDIIKAMQSVLDNSGNEYFPVIESGSSFRKKFTNIENYKQSKNSQDEMKKAFLDFLDD